MTITRMYEVGDTLIPIHVVLKWYKSRGNVFKIGQLIFLFFCITKENALIGVLYPHTYRHFA